MKKFFVLGLASLASVLCLPSSLQAQAPQLLNYQGRLLNGTNLVNGLVALRLRIYDAPTGGTLLYEDFGEPDVVDGLYSTFLGDGTTTGSLARALSSISAYLEVVANNQVLTPRERIGSVAYAVHAWGLSGNANTLTGTNFIGTTDDRPLDFRAGNARALRIEPTFIGEPNILLGVSGNAVGAGILGATIGGGGQNGGPGPNRIDGSYSTVAGGSGNRILTSADYSVVGGGIQNVINSNANGSVIGGGENNDVGLDGNYAVVPGGRNNAANANDTLAAGRNARANHPGSFVWADGQSTFFGTSTSNQFLIRAAGGIGINTTNNEADVHIFGGSAGSVSAHSSALLVVENSTSAFVHILTPANAVQGLLFGTPTNSLDASIRYNNIGERELTLRTLNATRMLITSNGLVGINQNSPTSTLHVGGTITCTTINETSDRGAKEAFAPVEPTEILDRVASMPVQYWRYRGQQHRHIGPTAQDFHAAFAVGENDLTISGIDRDGVSFAAIQALAAADRDQRSEVIRLRAEAAADREGQQDKIMELEQTIRDLRSRLETLEKK